MKGSFNAKVSDKKIKISNEESELPKMKIRASKKFEGRSKTH